MRVLLRQGKAGHRFQFSYAQLVPGCSLTLCLPIKMHGVKPAGAMKTLSGTCVLKLVILAASATPSIVLISACERSQRSLAPAGNAPPILIIMSEPGVKVRASSDDVEKAFDNLISKHGENVCNVDYYDKDQKKLWHRGNRELTMTSAMRSEAAGNPASADPTNLTQKVAFDSLDESQTFFSTINPTPTPTPAP